MQPAAGERMRPRKVFVEVYSQPRQIWRHNIAVIPPVGVADQVTMKPAAGADRLGNQQIRNRGGQLDIRRPFNRPGIEMGGPFRR